MENLSLPHLHFAHRQRAVDYDKVLVEQIAMAALPACIPFSKKSQAPLAALSSVEISILGPRAMARVHRDFLGIPGATDVITFPYGEILVCASIAEARAREFGNTPTIEVALYVIHGLLHLSGLDDIDPADALQMAETQQKVLEAAMAEIPGQ
jgi:probable rRNA maturation factor